MDAFLSLVDGSWRTVPGAIAGLFGLVVLWRGLFGERGLLRRKISLLDRLEGWRVSLFGLTVVGMSAAWLWESRLFLFLTLGIAITEIREARAVIAAMKGERHREAARDAMPSSRARKPPDYCTAPAMKAGTSSWSLASALWSM